ncbi:helix-turn-helix domain-containing protein [Streptomyces sp. NPDC051776]|uniref:TetR/AcrR family transcriptional regulator n=1 Tax=Streptomyces sp. NPDC051776 TaxID=3155414 RepID=UPI00341CC46F
MPTARESLLNAAFAALAGRPWSAVRMVDVAAAAGVSRQTLYNEFGSKDGLARALVRREADVYLAGVDGVLATGRTGAGEPGADDETDPVARLAAVAEWTVRSARRSPLLRAVLTGFYSERLPAPVRTVGASASYVPAQRRADAVPPSAGEMLRQVRDRAAAVLERDRPGEEAQRLARACEVAVRLALSYVVVPAGADDPALLVRRCVPGLVPPRAAPRQAAPVPGRGERQPA